MPAPISGSKIPVVPGLSEDNLVLIETLDELLSAAEGNQDLARQILVVISEELTQRDSRLWTSVEASLSGDDRDKLGQIRDALASDDTLRALLSSIESRLQSFVGAQGERVSAPVSAPDAGVLASGSGRILSGETPSVSRAPKVSVPLTLQPTDPSQNRVIKRIAVINRGEPVNRFLKTVRNMKNIKGEDYEVVVLYTDPDASSLYVREANANPNFKAVYIGAAMYQDAKDPYELDDDGTIVYIDAKDDKGDPLYVLDTSTGRPQEDESGNPLVQKNPKIKEKSQYLNHDLIYSVLEKEEVDAAWLGWGFVSEDGNFIEGLEQRNITPIAPNSKSVKHLGDKIASKLLAEKVGAPVSPWTGKALHNVEEAVDLIESKGIGYPAVLKASAGGGGRGIFFVRNEAELRASFDRAKAMALKFFGSDAVFIEAAIDGARHVEVQIWADKAGHVMAVGDRDCTLQRGNQKLIEVAHSPWLPESVRQNMFASAVAIAKEAGYDSAGTVEFLYDPRTDQYYFMEMNTRLQVEHPATELVTGIDLVAAMIRSAEGQVLVSEGSPQQIGVAVEVRLLAESVDPETGKFTPAPGLITEYRPPNMSNVRVDSAVAQGDRVTKDFDSMFAKLIAWGADRDAAMDLAGKAVREMVIVGEDGFSDLNSLAAELLDLPQVRNGEGVHTRWLQDYLLERDFDVVTPLPNIALLAAAAMYRKLSNRNGRDQVIELFQRSVPPAEIPSLPPSKLELGLLGHDYAFSVQTLAPNTYLVHVDGLVKKIHLEEVRLGSDEYALTIDGVKYNVTGKPQDGAFPIKVNGDLYPISTVNKGKIVAPSPGKINEILVKEGDVIKIGDRVGIIEAMKMENEILTSQAGQVVKVYVSVGSTVKKGAPLLELEALAESGTEGFILADRQSALMELSVSVNQFVLKDQNLARMHDGQDSYYIKADKRGIVESIAISQDTSGPTHPVVEKGGALFKIRPALAPRVVFNYTTEDIVPMYLAADSAVSQRAFDAVAADPRRHVPEIVAALNAGFMGYSTSALQGKGNSTASRLFTLLADLSQAAQSPEDIEFFTEQWVNLLETYTDIEILFQRHYREGVTGSHPLQNPSYLAQFEEIYMKDISQKGEKNSLDFQAVLLRALAHYQVYDLAVSDRLTHSLHRMIRSHVNLPQKQDLAFQINRYLRTLCDSHKLDFDNDRLNAVVDRMRHMDISPYESGSQAFIYSARSLHHGLSQNRDTNLSVPLWANPNAELPKPIQERIELWRLKEFELTRLAPEAGDVILYKGHPKAASKVDHRNQQHFAFALIEKVTPKYQDGKIVDVPEIKRGFRAAVNSILEAQLKEDRPFVLNRATVYVEPELIMSEDEIRTMILHLASESYGMGLEKTVIRLRKWKSSADAPAKDIVIEASRGDGLSINVEYKDPLTEENGGVIRPLTQAKRKRALAKAYGIFYPYDIVSTHSGLIADRGFGVGTFQELEISHSPAVLDFEALNAFMPEAIEREEGSNPSNMVIGEVLVRTARHPEGQRRVVIIGDGTKGKGPLAEPESLRIIAALNYAETHHLPVDWFPISSGAKISTDSGTENLDWTAGVLRRIIHFTQDGGTINVIASDLNIGAQAYWNAEATMMMHNKGLLIMLPNGNNVLTGVRALQVSGSPTPRNEVELGGYARVAGPNGQAQYFARNWKEAYDLLLHHADANYVAAGEDFPRANPSALGDLDRSLTHPELKRDPKTLTDTVEELLQEKGLEQGQVLQYRVAVIQLMEKQRETAFDSAEAFNSLRDYLDWSMIQLKPFIEGPSQSLSLSQDEIVRALMQKGVAAEELAYFRDPAVPLEDDPKAYVDVARILMDKQRKSQFSMRAVMTAVADRGAPFFERWADQEDGEMVIVTETDISAADGDRILGGPVALIGIDAQIKARKSEASMNGPVDWLGGTLYPQGSKKLARALNAASGVKPAVILANLSGFDGSDESLRKLQLEFGAELGRAVVNFKGPLVFVITTRLHGGAYVVFSRATNPNLRFLALEGTFANVISGAVAAEVGVLKADILDRTKVLLASDEYKNRLAGLDPENKAAKEIKKEAAFQAKLDSIKAYDEFHTVERAKEIGSVEQIIKPGEVRNQILHYIELGKREYLERERAERLAAQQRSAEQVLGQMTMSVLQQLGLDFSAVEQLVRMAQQAAMAQHFDPASQGVGAADVLPDDRPVAEQIILKGRPLAHELHKFYVNEGLNDVARQSLNELLYGRVMPDLGELRSLLETAKPGSWDRFAERFTESLDARVEPVPGR